jgi:hypothetical protein
VLRSSFSIATSLIIIYINLEYIEYSLSPALFYTASYYSCSCACARARARLRVCRADGVELLTCRACACACTWVRLRVCRASGIELSARWPFWACRHITSLKVHKSRLVDDFESWGQFEERGSGSRGSWIINSVVETDVESRY